jgi:hypothetical protein
VTRPTRGQIAVVGILLVAGAVSLYRGLRPRPEAARHVDSKGANLAESTEDVPEIGLARLDALTLAPPGEAEAMGAQPVPEPTASSSLPPPSSTPAGLGGGPGDAGGGVALPPMNVRFLGAVQAREGVWVAALLTDRKELLTGKEGDTVGNRFRIVKIGIESIDLLDVTSGRQRRVRLGGA